MVKLLARIFRKTLPKDLKFSPGQKVFCSKTHEVPGCEIECGTIIKFSMMAKSYWAFSGKPSPWYLVKYATGKRIVLPQEVITDLDEAISKHRSFEDIKKERPYLKIGDRGYSWEAVSYIEEMQTKRLLFKNNL